MKKVIILRKIHVAIKSFALPFFNHFSLSMNRKTRGNESHEKETKHFHASATNLLHISIGNLNWWKCGLCKNEVREINCSCSREVDYDAYCFG